jgi:ATP-dependent helicase/nuclease subunit A
MPTIWAGRKADDVPDVAAARAAANAEAEHEYRRLLYVAMTRAAQRLIICGADGLRKRPQDCWYDLVRNALDPFLVAEGEGDEKVLLYREGSRDDVAAPPVAAEAKSQSGEIPPWLRQRFRQMSRGSRRLRLRLSTTIAARFLRASARRKRGRKRCGAAVSCIG